MAVSDTAKGLGIAVFGIGAMVALFSLGALLLIGMAEFSLWVLKFTPTAFEICVIATLLFAIMAIIPQSRGWAGLGFLYVSFGYGVILWFYGMAYTYITWGMFAVVLGIVVFGVGVVPIAIIATIVHGHWNDLAQFIFMLFLTYGTRLVSIWFISKADERAERMALLASKANQRARRISDQDTDILDY